MKRWDIDIGGLVFAALLVVALLVVAASMVGHLLIAIGLFRA